MQPFPKLTEREATSILAGLKPVLVRLVAEPGYKPNDATEEYSMLLWGAERLERAGFSEMAYKEILRMAGVSLEQSACLWQWYARCRLSHDQAGVIAELERWLRNGLGVRGSLGEDS